VKGKIRLGALALVMAAGQAPAQEVVLGAGYANYNGRTAIDDWAFALEYHHRPFFERNRFALAFGAALSADMRGDAHAGVGLVATYDLSPRWFVEASVMPGAYWENISFNDLGSRFQIRSLLALGYVFETGNKVSLALTHKSNASTASYNPGVDTALLRYHVAF